MPANSKKVDRLAALAAEVEELRGRVARLEAARVARRPAAAPSEPTPPPRVLSLADPDPARDDEFAKPMPQLGKAKAPWPD